MLSRYTTRFLVFAVTLLALSPSPSVAQPSEEEIMLAFGRLTGGDQFDMTVVHLNDLTTDMLFEAPAKYSLRAQARQATMFYVQGTALQDTVLDLEVVVVVDRAFPGRLINIQNFEPGTELSEGDQFLGIVALEDSINLTLPFKINIGDRQVEYIITPNHRRWLEEARNPQQ